MNRAKPLMQNLRRAGQARRTEVDSPSKCAYVFCAVTVRRKKFGVMRQNKQWRSLRSSEVSGVLSSEYEDRASNEIDLGRVFNAVWRSKLLIIVCTFLFMSISAYYALFVAVPLYSSTTELKFQPQSQGGFDFRATSPWSTLDNSLLATEAEVIRSGELISELIERLSLEDDPEFNPVLRERKFDFPDGALSFFASFVMTEQDSAEISARNVSDKVAKNIRGKIKVSTKRGVNVLKISMTTSNPDKSALIANNLANIYLEDQVEAKIEANRFAVDWLSERVHEMGAELRQKREELDNLKVNSEIDSAEQLSGLRSQLKNMRDRLDRSEKELLQTRQKRKAAVSKLASKDFRSIATLFNDPLLRRLIDSGNGRETQVSLHERARQQIFELEQLIKAQEERYTALRESYNAQLKRIDNLNSEIIVLEQRSLEVDATQALYDLFVSRQKEMTLQVGLQQSDARVLTVATPGARVAPHTTAIVAIGLLLGAAASIALAIWREMALDVFRTTAELQASTKRAVLGQIPKLNKRLVSNIGQYLNKNPTSVFAESVRNFRTSITMVDADQSPKVIMLTSSVPSEGKSTTSISLAHSFVGVNKKVLLIDADIRRRSLETYLSVQADVGLVDFLVGDVSVDECILKSEELGFDILLGGHEPRLSAADIFASINFEKMIADLRQRYDYIVIDTPPVLVVPDARIIAQNVDASIYVVLWDATQKMEVRNGLRELQSVGVDATGLVLTSVDHRGMSRYGYGSGMGAYGSYGKSGYFG